MLARFSISEPGATFHRHAGRGRQDKPLVSHRSPTRIKGRCPAREHQALRYLFQGMDYASIARRLKKPNGEPISAATVKQYVERARAKFAAAGRPCRSNFALLARCIEDGLVRPEEINDYPNDCILGPSVLR